jgi:hypothetical protein
MSCTVILIRWAGAGLLAAAAGASAAEGLRADDPALLWPTWQARLTLTMAEPLAGGARTLRQAALLGDRYLLTHGDAAGPSGWRGGLRATGGLVAGHLGAAGPLPIAPLAMQLQSLAEPAGPEAAIRPYIGLGYSGLWPQGGLRLSADLGLVARQPSGAAGLGRALLGQQGLDSALRQLDLSPMVRLGLSYSF